MNKDLVKQLREKVNLMDKKSVIFPHSSTSIRASEVNELLSNYDLFLSILSQFLAVNEYSGLPGYTFSENGEEVCSYCGKRNKDVMQIKHAATCPVFEAKMLLSDE